MGHDLTGAALFGFFGFFVWIIGLALAITWLFLPWVLAGKLNRIIELLEVLAKQK